MTTVKFQLEVNDYDGINKYVLIWKDNLRSKWIQKAQINKREGNICFFEIKTTQQEILYKYVDEDNQRLKQKYQILSIKEIDFIQKDIWGKQNISIELNFQDISYSKNIFFFLKNNQDEKLLNFQNYSKSSISDTIILDQKDEKVYLKVEYYSEVDFNLYTSYFEIELNQSKRFRQANVLKLKFDQQDILNIISIQNKNKMYKTKNQNLNIKIIQSNISNINDQTMTDKFEAQLQSIELYHKKIDKFLQQHEKKILEIPIKLQQSTFIEDISQKIKLVNNYIYDIQNQSKTLNLPIQVSKIGINEKKKIAESVKLPKIKSFQDQEFKLLLKGSEKNHQEKRCVEQMFQDQIKCRQMSLRKISFQKQFNEIKDNQQNNQQKKYHTEQVDIQDNIQFDKITSNLNQAAQKLIELLNKQIQDQFESQKSLQEQIARLQQELKQQVIDNEKQKNMNHTYLCRIIQLVRKQRQKKKCNCSKISKNNTNNNEVQEDFTKNSEYNIMLNSVYQRNQNTVQQKNEDELPSFLSVDDIRNPMLYTTQIINFKKSENESQSRQKTEIQQFDSKTSLNQIEQKNDMAQTH